MRDPQMAYSKPVRISRQLEERFNRLPNRGSWEPAGFPEFVREATRYYLERQERLAQFGVAEEREEADRGTPARPQADTRGRRK